MAKATTTPAPAAGRRFDAATLIRIKAARAWRPNAGDTINGTIVAVVPRDGEYGVYPVVVLDTGADAYTAVHAFHGVLINELREMKAAPGMAITILYSGKQDHNKATNSDGSKRQYHGYSVVPEDGATVDTWDFSEVPAPAGDSDVAPY